MLSLLSFENFSGFQLQDKHNASYYPIYLGMSQLNPTTKVRNNLVVENKIEIILLFVESLVFRI